MSKKKQENVILLGITGEKKDWESKLNDINKLGITKAALFLERFDQTQRKKIYRALLDSSLREIPLCHIRNDMEIEELVFMEAKFKTKYFTVHENSFAFLNKWPGFEKKLYLEMNTDNFVSDRVKVEKIGGFCVDLSHFFAAAQKQTKDFEYVYYKKGKANFACNHISGYDGKNNSDLHTVKNVKSFDYLKQIPEFLFGKIMALEVENSILTQIEFKKIFDHVIMEIIKLDDKNFKKTVRIAEKFIKSGKVVVCPTDTVYGLICDAKNKKAVAKIFKIKKRSWQKPLSIFVKNLAMARKFAKINKIQEKFLEKVWPGQTIAVLEAKRNFPKGIVSEPGRIGLRVPDYKLLNILLKEFGSYLAQTSANISGEPPSREIKEILKQFQGEKYLPDLILDGGKLKSKKPSQVVDFTQKKPKIIRE